MAEISAKEARLQLINAVDELSRSTKLAKEGLSSQQLVEEGKFGEDFVQKNEILNPPYNPVVMSRIAENSSILPQCIDAMVLNTDGFGQQFFYTGPQELEDSKEVLAERENLTKFFGKVNESESFVTVRKQMRKDLETTGNGYIELIRTMNGEIGVLYHADSNYIRLQKKQAVGVPIKVKLWRRGKIVEISVVKRFRRYVMITSTSKKKYKWFKEYGDPRIMNADTGKYEGEDGFVAGENIATEIIHFKIGNGPYGIPRWAGSSVTAIGLHSSDFVNYDLFENQVVPPLAIMVSGGKLTSESIQDIKNILVQKKGTENFNKVLILEAMTDGDVADKSSTKIELKEMSSARKEDAMFTKYTDAGEHRIRGAFRLPPLYLGRADSYSKSTADSSKMVAEEQVFVPERNLFDEYVNLTLMEELKVQYHEYKSIGPRLITGEQIIDGFSAFAKSGVFTINEGIRLANRTLGLDITLYQEDWANFPIAIVVELARQGQLAGMEDISTAASSIGDLVNSLPENVDSEEAEEKVLKAYNAILALQKAVSKHQARREIQEKAEENSLQPKLEMVE